MKIAIIHPSRLRAEIAGLTVRAWLDNAWQDSDTRLEYWLGYEWCEHFRYEPVVAQLEQCYPGMFRKLVIHGQRVDSANLPKSDEVSGYLTATTKANLLIENAQADWIIAVADNFFPFPDWLETLLLLFKAHQAAPLVMGYPGQLERGLVSHPIMNKAFFNWHGRTIMRKEYIHTHGDLDLFWTAKKAGFLYPLPPHCKPVHNHPYIDHKTPEDELHRLNYSKAFLEQGRAVWERRKRILGVT